MEQTTFLAAFVLRILSPAPLFEIENDDTHVTENKAQVMNSQCDVSIFSTIVGKIRPPEEPAGPLDREIDSVCIN